MDFIGTNDLLAFAWFLTLMLGYQLVTAVPAIYDRSINAEIQRQRVLWMREMSSREARVVDVNLLGNLAQGSGFFASTTLIIIGGLATLMGSGHKVQVLLERLPFVAKSSSVLWEMKLILVMAIFVFAFFKFAWSFRLSHYAAIMIGACPTRTENNAEQCLTHGDATAELIGISAHHSNKGLRSFYHAIAGISWFVHPLLFMAVSTGIIIVLIRRDYFSRARAAVSVGNR